MTKSIPIKFTEDNSADKLIDYVFGKDTNVVKEPMKSQETVSISHEKEEKVVSYTADIKTYAIIVLLLISVGFALGWYIMGGRERLIQDIDSLKFSNHKIQMNIDSLMIQKSQNDSAIEKDKKLLKEKYNTIYQ